MERVEKREKEYSDVLSSLDFLGDPFDNMNIDEKKKHALFLYYDRIKVCMNDRPITLSLQLELSWAVTILHLILFFLGWVCGEWLLLWD